MGRRTVTEKGNLDRQIEVVDDRVAEILRRKSPAERVEIIFDLNRTMRVMIAGHLRSRHPGWTEEQVQAEVARRMTRGTT